MNIRRYCGHYEKVEDPETSDQVRLCGNAVCPPIASAIVKANYARIAEAVEVGA